MNEVEFNPGERHILDRNDHTRASLIIKILMALRLAKTPEQATYMALFLFSLIIAGSIFVITSTLDKNGDTSKTSDVFTETTIIGQVPGQI